MPVSSLLCDTRTHQKVTTIELLFSESPIQIAKTNFSNHNVNSWFTVVMNYLGHLKEKLYSCITAVKHHYFIKNLHYVFAYSFSCQFYPYPYPIWSQSHLSLAKIVYVSFYILILIHNTQYYSGIICRGVAEGFQVVLVIRNPPFNVGDTRDFWFISPCLGKILTGMVTHLHSRGE